MEILINILDSFHNLDGGTKIIATIIGIPVAIRLYELIKKYIPILKTPTFILFITICILLLIYDNFGYSRQLGITGRFITVVVLIVLINIVVNLLKKK